MFHEVQKTFTCKVVRHTSTSQGSVLTELFLCFPSFWVRSRILLSLELFFLVYYFH